MRKTFITAAVMLVPWAALAQFVPTLDDAPSVCPDRPAQPTWIDNIDVREAHKGGLVQQMYRAQSLRAVAESGYCSCETRFPSWDAAEAYFLDHYAGLERFEILERTSEYSQTANQYRRTAIPICREQGNW